jgi:hypothetical protein
MDSFDQTPNEDDLKAENEFLKMKLMLEHGAKFSSNESELPPEMENEFLNSVMAFEKQFEQYKTIKVYDKVGRPTHFKPVTEIPDDEIDKAWSDLRVYLNEHNVDLDACSPNISTRELYRFTIEELFEHETDDMDLPGWTTNFIYDEFHPDPVYDNTRVATNDCINYILQKEPMEWDHNFRKEGLRLNKHYPLQIDEFRNVINRFKMAYNDIEIKEIAGDKCIVNDKLSNVTGKYAVTAMIGADKHELSGNWEVIFHLDEELGYWYITDVEIGGIDF